MHFDKFDGFKYLLDNVANYLCKYPDGTDLYIHLSKKRFEKHSTYLNNVIISKERIYKIKTF